MGRFLSRDPLGFHDHSYAGDNPLSFRDPSGLAPEEKLGLADAPDYGLPPEGFQAFRSIFGDSNVEASSDFAGIPAPVDSGNGMSLGTTPGMPTGAQELGEGTSVATAPATEAVVAEGPSLEQMGIPLHEDLDQENGIDRTIGVFTHGENQEVVASGWFDASKIPELGEQPFMNTHVELKTADFMRTNGITSGTLELNNIPCEDCVELLPQILPMGSSLRVVVPGYFDMTFMGA